MVSTPEQLKESSERDRVLRETRERLRGLQEEVEKTTFSRETVYALGEEKLRDLVMHDTTEDLKSKPEKISGKIAFFNKNFELWIGLKHLLPDEYKFALITKPNGEQVRGERQNDGSFYENGNYVAIWDGYSFEAYINRPADWPKQTSAEATAPQSPQPTPVSSEHREKPGELEKVPIEQTAFFGDSLTVGMQVTHSLNGGLVRAKGGRQTSAILEEFKCFIAERRAGSHSQIKRVVVLGGVNDIASGKTLAQITRNLAEIYRLARENGLTVVGVTHHKWDTEAFLKRFEQRWRKPHKYTAIQLTEMTANLNAWIRQAARVDQVADAETEFDNQQRTGAKMLGSDGLHPSGRGTRILAETIKREGQIAA